MARDCSVTSITTQNFLALTKVDLSLGAISRLLSLLGVIDLPSRSERKSRAKVGNNLHQVFVSVSLYLLSYNLLNTIDAHNNLHVKCNS